MAAQTKTILKSYFETGDVPTQAQFASLIETIGTPTLMVAASDASATSKGRADYVCDGTADEVEIQAAIDALPAGGGRVLLSEGIFTCDASQELVMNLTGYCCIRIDEGDGPVELAGSPGTVLKLSASQPGNSSIVFVTGFAHARNKRTIVRGIEFDGNGANQSNNWSDFGCVHSNNWSRETSTGILVVRDCYFHGMTTNGSGMAGVYCAGGGVKQNVISGNYFEGNNLLIRTHDSLNLITDNIFRGTAGATADSMVMCSVGEPTLGQTDTTIISNNLFFGGFYQLSLVGVQYITVANNVFSTVTHADGCALSLQEQDDGDQLRSHALRNLVNANLFYNIPVGIRLAGNASYGARYNLVTNNQIIEGPDVALAKGVWEIGDSALGNRIINNSIDAGATVGIVRVNAEVRGNSGYITENQGAAATTSYGGTIAHGCAAAPAVATVSGSVAGETVTVTSIDATNITVAIKKADGSAGTAQTVYWRASV